VKKGQLLLRVQSADMSAAFSDYRKAVADGKLARIQFERAKLLFDKGAISLNDFQTAEDVENKAQWTWRTPQNGFASSGATSIIRPQLWKFALRSRE